MMIDWKTLQKYDFLKAKYNFAFSAHISSLSDKKNEHFLIIWAHFNSPPYGQYSLSF